MKVEITSSGMIGGRDTKLVLDGVDVSKHCTGISLGIECGEPVSLTATFLVKDLSIEMDRVDPKLIEDKKSEGIRQWLMAKAVAGQLNG